MNVCTDENYLPSADVENLKQQGWRVLRLLNGYLRFLRNQQVEKKMTLHETPPPYATAAEDPLNGQDL